MDRRYRSRGVVWTPTREQVKQARAAVREGIAVHPRWLPYLTPRLRVVARLSEPVNQCRELA